MKKAILFCAAALVIAAPASHAGLDLAWNNCATGGGVGSITLDCLAGPNQLFGNIQIGEDMPQYLSLDIVLDFQTDQNPLPSFWHFGSGQCGDGSVVMAVGKFASCPGASNLLCGATGTGCQFANAYRSGGVDPPSQVASNRGKFLGSIFRPAGSPIAVSATTDYFAFRFDIFSFHSTEAGGTCAGCAAPMAIVWNSALASGLSVGGASPEAQEVVVDQPGLVGNGASANGGAGLLGATPAQATSWGQIKALYR